MEKPKKPIFLGTSSEGGLPPPRPVRAGAWYNWFFWLLLVFPWVFVSFSVDSPGFVWFFFVVPMVFLDFSSFGLLGLLNGATASNKQWKNPKTKKSIGEQRKNKKKTMAKPKKNLFSGGFLREAPPSAAPGPCGCLVKLVFRFVWFFHWFFCWCFRGFAMVRLVLWFFPMVFLGSPGVH